MPKTKHVTERATRNIEMVTKIVTEKMGGQWVKATVTYKQLYHLAAGLPLAMKLQSENIASMCYFARYTSAPFRIELQILTKEPLHKLRKFIMEYSIDNVRATSVKFEPCTGSVPHALAFSIVGGLKLANQLNMEMLRDVFHWAYNMAGFSYLQEAASSTVQSWAALRGIPGWSSEPAFGPRHKHANAPQAPRRRVKTKLRRAKS